MEREEGCWEIVSKYTRFINSRPDLISFLYDVDMLPEQCYTVAGAIKLSYICFLWMMGEQGKIPAAPEDAAPWPFIPEDENDGC